MRDVVRIGLTIAFFLFSACGGDDDGPAPMDAGGELDSGGGTDASAPDASVADGGVDAPGRDAGPPECGNFEIEGTELCDDGNTVGGDGCSPDCMSDESCGNGITDDHLGEVCDDGNTLNGDGCNASCTSDESCGNGLVDLGEVCDDGNTIDDDGCSGDCSMGPVCGDGAVHGMEACDDGNTTGGDGCSADCMSDESCGNGTVDTAAGEMCDDGNTTAGDGCSPACNVEICGNGIVDAGEDCDDDNDVSGDGCEADCTFSCTMDAECDDGALCNGTETCDTTTNVCASGTNASDGTDCGGGMVCRSGMCVLPVCGNSIVDPGEECDDGNTTNGDGCENDCTFSCTVDADCDDGRLCNGAETCDTTTNVCSAGTNAPNGTLCDRDMNPGTRDICRMGTCSASTCGDGYHDMGAGEACDDGNATSGDGCEPDCTVTGAVMPTAYRIDDLWIREPHIYDSFPIFGCYDITDGAPLGNDGVNDSLNASVDDFSLSYITVHRPLDLTMMTNPVDFVDGTCMAGATRPSCSVGSMGTVYPLTGTNRSSGNCFTADPATVRPYTPAVPVIGPSCFVTNPMDLTVNIAGIAIPFRQARIAATYGTGSPPDTLGPGVIAGYLETADAMAIRFPDGTPAVGGDTLYQHLAAARAPGSSCSTRDDRDDHPVTGAADDGFWFYIEFRSIRADWTGP